MTLKPGVKLLGVKPELVVGLAVAEEIYRKHGESLVVTAVTDGKHSTGSLHYAGQAADLRTRGLKDVDAVVADLKVALDGEFDVVKEADHIHLEWQVKQ